MTENIYRSFTLNNSLAAVSATPLEAQTLATDGKSCVIHQIDPCGRNLGCHTTLRALRRLRSYSFCSAFTALGCCNDKTVYFLDENLLETNAVRLDTRILLSCNGFGGYSRQSCGYSGGCNNGCNGGCGCSGGCSNQCCGDSNNSGCNCTCNNGCGGVCNNGGSCNSNCSMLCTWDCGLEREPFSELTDASLTQIGNETYIIGVFPKGAFLFDLNGRLIEQLCKADGGEVLTDFIRLENGVFAMATLCGNIRRISIYDNGIVHSNLLDRNEAFRMFIDVGGELYGLFGRNYIYNRIMKINS